MNPTVEKLQNLICNSHKGTQKKAVKIIKKNSALEQLSGENFKRIPDHSKTFESIEHAKNLGGDDLVEYINSLKQEAIDNQWHLKARKNYKIALKEYKLEQKQEIKKNGYFSSNNTVAWVKIKVLKNLAHAAGVTGLSYHINRLLHKQVVY